MKRIITIIALASLPAGAVIYLLAPSRSTVHTIHTADIASAHARPSIAVRDPFSTVAQTAAAPSAPRMKLSGILFSESAPEALVSVDGATRTVRTGDSVGGETILQITRDHIIIAKYGRKYKLTSRSWERAE